MLYVRPLAPPEQRALRQLQRGAPYLAQRARMLLWSAAGWSVPAIAQALGCCRRTVRAWIHAFQREGLRGIIGQPLGRPPHCGNPVSAMSSAPTDVVPAVHRPVPVIPLTVPEIRRLLNEVVWHQRHSMEFTLYWSIYRRYKQALAKRSHYRKRGAEPPEFQQLRL
jgi:hypothetical protein